MVQVVAVQAVETVDGGGAGVHVQVDGAVAGDLRPWLNSLPGLGLLRVSLYN